MKDRNAQKLLYNLNLFLLIEWDPHPSFFIIIVFYLFFFLFFFFKLLYQH